MTVLIRLSWPVLRFNNSAGRSYLIPRTVQTLLPLSFMCLDHWKTPYVGKYLLEPRKPWKWYKICFGTILKNSLPTRGDEVKSYPKFWENLIHIWAIVIRLFTIEHSLHSKNLNWICLYKSENFTVEKNFIDIYYIFKNYFSFIKNFTGIFVCLKWNHFLLF